MTKPANTETMDLLHQGRKAFVSGLTYAAILSAVINVLQLTVPLFMLQVHDRVVNSQSTDTLIMLIVVAAVALATYCALDYVRALTYQVMASKLVRKLNLPVLQAAVSASVTKSVSQSSQAIRDLNDIRSFVVGNAISVPLEALWAPIFLGVLFALHWLYGLVALISATIILSFSLLSDFLTRRATKRANESALQNIGEISGSLRHAEAIEAMGMLPALASRWRRNQLHTQDLLDVTTRRSRALASVTRTCRYLMQIAVLSIGAILVINQEVSAGSMVASSIIMGRMLLPFDSMVDGWRQWVIAAAAWKNVQDLLENQAPKRETKPTPTNSGRSQGRPPRLRTARIRRAGAQGRVVPALPRRGSRHRRPFGGGKVDAGAHAHRRHEAHDRRRLSRRQQRLSLGERIVRRHGRVSAAERLAPRRNDPRQHRPHAGCRSPSRARRRTPRRRP